MDENKTDKELDISNSERDDYRDYSFAKGIDYMRSQIDINKFWFKDHSDKIMNSQVVLDYIGDTMEQNHKIEVELKNNDCKADKDYTMIKLNYANIGYYSQKAKGFRFFKVKNLKLKTDNDDIYENGLFWTLDKFSFIQFSEFSYGEDDKDLAKASKYAKEESGNNYQLGFTFRPGVKLIKYDEPKTVEVSTWHSSKSITNIAFKKLLKIGKFLDFYTKLDPNVFVFFENRK